MQLLISSTHFFEKNTTSTMITLTNNLTEAQTTAFFTAAGQIGLEDRTYEFFQSEGIHTISDLFDMNNDILDTIASNARKPTGTVPDPAPNAVAGARVPTPPYLIGAKSLHRLKISIVVIQYLAKTDRPVEAAHLQWNVLRDFNDHWTILQDKSKADFTPSPRLDKKSTCLRWFNDHLKEWTGTNVGLQGAPLSYVTRTTALPDANAPPFLANRSYSATHGSVEEELVHRCTHDHPAFTTDNAAVFDAIEKALRGTIFYPTIKPHSKKKDGRAAWISLKGQYLGEAKWRQEIKECEDLVNTRVWKGNSHMTLEKFVAMHRNANSRLEAAALHTPFQVPDGFRTCERLMNAIQTTDPLLQAAMAQIRSSNDPNGPRSDFEQCVAALIPHCPVVRLRKPGGGRQGGADTMQGFVGAFNLKAGKGESGVEFRYYSKQEYLKLPNHQKEELRSFRNAKREAGQSPKLSDGNKKQKQSGATRFDKKFKRAVSQVVAEMVNAEKPATDTIVADISNVSAIVPATKTGSSLAGVLRRNIKENGKKTA
jgi:hypothetical protein